MEERVLSYGDVLLRKEDVKILRSEFEWINDRIIDFYVEYLSKETLGDSFKDEILLAGSSVSFWISCCENNEDTSNILKSMNAENMKILMFPVNNNDSPSVAGGGSHWSLLLYLRTSNVFLHLDSCQGTNLAPAQRLFSKLRFFLGGNKSRMIAPRCPQQSNSHDCGVYILAFMHAICTLAGEVNQSGAKKTENMVDELGIEKTLMSEINRAYVGQFRKYILSLIEELSQREQY